MHHTHVAVHLLQVDRMLWMMLSLSVWHLDTSVLPSPCTAANLRTVFELYEETRRPHAGRLLQIITVPALLSVRYTKRKVTRESSDSRNDKPT